MSNEIRIDDLLAPQLIPAQKAALDYGDTLDVQLTEDVILDMARRRTGLSDFGPEDFKLRLRLILDEWNADPWISGLHRSTLQGYVVRHMCNRLLMHDILKRHPEIHDVKIERPIIVAGLPRSGTTHLLNLMAADQRLRSLPLWESYEPLPIPGEGLLPDGTDPRYRRCAEAWVGLQTVLPLLAAMHPMEPDHIHEELELMGPDMASYNFEWLSPVPRWRDYYYEHDQTPHYEYMKTGLKILQWIRGPNRWVLKCPQHLEQLTVLKRVFPDATFVITHRDPVAVIQSAITMQAYGQRIYRKRIEPKWLIEYWSDRVEHLLRACVRDRGAIPESQSIDVPFHEFMADDLAMIARIHAKAGLETTPAARQQLADFMRDHPRGKEGRVIYNLKRDFGVEPAVLRERFKFYFDKFPVRAESK